LSLKIRNTNITFILTNVTFIPSTFTYHEVCCITKATCREKACTPTKIYLKHLKTSQSSTGKEKKKSKADVLCIVQVPQDHSGLENWKSKPATVTPICYRIFDAELVKRFVPRKRASLKTDTEICASTVSYFGTTCLFQSTHFQIHQHFKLCMNIPHISLYKGTRHFPSKPKT